MSDLLSITNGIDHQEYFLSIMRVEKKFKILPTKKKAASQPAAFDHVIFEASIYKEKTKIKPLFTMYLDNPTDRGYADFQFGDPIRDMVSKERIEDLTNEETHYGIFQKYGFVSELHEIWFIFPLKRIMAVFLMFRTEQMVLAAGGKALKVLVEKPTQARLKELGVFSWGIWTKEYSTFDWHYAKKEVCYILEGEVTVKTIFETISFGKGDLVTFPEGLDCTWQIRQNVRKHFKFGD